MISPHIFRAYDIRGIYAENLTEEVMELIGHGWGTIAQQRGRRQVLVAKDGRLSGPALAQALKKGLLASGCDVIDIGSVPTPVLYFATHISGIDCGLMLTGSHNPSQYNGLKMVMNGRTFFGEDIQSLYQLLQTQRFIHGHGQESVRHDLLDLYIKRIAADIKLNKPLTVAIDCGNGIAGAVAPRLFKQLGCDVVPLYCEVDGHFTHHHPDPSKAENLQALIDIVTQKKLAIGLAFDGDADRLGVVTDRGEIIWPDRQLILLAQDILTRHPRARIIYDVKCTTHLKKAIEASGGIAMMSRTGHSYLKTALQQYPDALLAGEMSGHFFFKERWYGFDDGLYAGARLLEIIARQAASSSEIFNAIPNSLNTPELQCGIHEDNKFHFISQLIDMSSFPHGTVSTLDGLRVDFADGWGLVRASNTTPCLVMRFEADNAVALERIKNDFRVAMMAIDSALELPF